MFVESLLIFACVSRNGCVESTANYAVYNKAAVERAAVLERQIPIELKSYVAPWLAFALNGEAVFRLNSLYSVKFGRNTQFLYTLNF